MKYTAGELAKKLGLSGRTIRFYDEKRLLTPCEYSEAGYRIYNDESAERLQKIIMLRFMDFSLEQISEMMQEEDFDVRKSPYTYSYSATKYGDDCRVNPNLYF